jgi:hypothetical protein
MVNRFTKGAASFKGAPNPAMLWLAAIMAVAALLRLANLDTLGPFADEYYHAFGAMNRSFMVDAVLGGKVLGYIIFYPTALLSHDKLYWLRALVALLGVGATAGVFMAALELGGLLCAVISGMMWALAPYIVFHDRMALHDPIENFFLAWFFFFMIRAFGKGIRINFAIAGVSLVLAVATKFIAFIGLLWIALMAFAFDNALSSIRRMALYLALMLAIPISFVAIHMYRHLDDFTCYTASFLGLGGGCAGEAPPIRLFERLAVNFSKLHLWLTGYNGTIFIAILSVSVALAFARPTRARVMLAITVIATSGAFATVFHGWYPRYYLPALVPTILLIGVTFGEFISTNASPGPIKPGVSKNTAIARGGAAIASLALIYMMAGWVAADYRYSHDISRAPFPDSDRAQYVTGGISSGAGYNETVAFLRRYLDLNKNTSLAIVARGGGREFFISHLFGKNGVPVPEFGWPYETFELLSSLVKEPGGKLLILGANNHVAPLLGVAPFIPAPHLLFSDNSGMVAYELKTPVAWAVADSTAVIKIKDANGEDVPDGQPSFWIGKENSSVKIVSPINGVASIKMKFTPGPSLQGRNDRQILMTVNGVSTEALVSAEYAGDIDVDVKRGINEIAVKSLDQPNVTQVNTQDKRLMALNIEVLGVSIKARANDGDGRVSVEMFEAVMKKVELNNKSGPPVIFAKFTGEISRLSQHGLKGDFRFHLLAPADLAVEITRAALSGKRALAVLGCEGETKLFSTAPQEILRMDGGWCLYDFQSPPWPARDVGGIIITNISNYNGVETWDGKTGFWLGDETATIGFISKKAGKMAVNAELSPGPSLGGGVGQMQVIGPDGSNFQIPVGAKAPTTFHVNAKQGGNMLSLKAVGMADPAGQPKGDKRKMLIGVRALQITHAGQDRGDMQAGGAAPRP